MTEASQGSQASARSNVAPGNMGIGHGLAKPGKPAGGAFGGAMPVPQVSPSPARPLDTVRGAYVTGTTADIFPRGCRCRSNVRGLEHGPIWADKPQFPSTFTSPTVATTTSRSPPAAYTPAPASPVQPVRWSLTNRIFSLNLRSLYQGPPRQPASRLWNPVNSSPRALQIENPPPQPPAAAPVAARAPRPQSAPREEYYPNLPIERDFGATHQARDEYPLLTLPERRLSRQSPVPSSLAVERSTADDSACISRRTSIGLPRDRRSQPPTPRFAMASTQDARDSASPVQHNDKDVEAGRNQQSAVSRVSLPTSQRSSMGFHDDQADDDDDDDDDDGASEFPWGPSHPCFPHPNPHVPLDSELYNTTRIIRIKRDWMMKGDLAPTFANLYPEILDPLILEDDFRTLIKHINDMLIAAFDPFTFRACLDTVMGVATFWLWEDAGLTGVKKQLVALERWIEDWNRDVGAKEAVKIISLRRTGYLTLDIQIPDPHLGPDTGTRPQTQEDQAILDQQHHQGVQYLPYPITPTLQVNSQPTFLGAHS